MGKLYHLIRAGKRLWINFWVMNFEKVGIYSCEDLQTDVDNQVTQLIKL